MVSTLLSQPRGHKPLSPAVTRRLGGTHPPLGSLKGALGIPKEGSSKLGSKNQKITLSNLLYSKWAKDWHLDVRSFHVSASIPGFLSTCFRQSHKFIPLIPLHFIWLFLEAIYHGKCFAIPSNQICNVLFQELQ